MRINIRTSKLCKADAFPDVGGLIQSNKNLYRTKRLSKRGLLLSYWLELEHQSLPFFRLQLPLLGLLAKIKCRLQLKHLSSWVSSLQAFRLEFAPLSPLILRPLDLD